MHHSHDGLGSIVTYSDGSTDIGSWHQEVPAPGRRVASVRQNLSLLIDHGTVASSVGCDSCWGATLGGVAAPARSALGITADGRLIWAGGEQLTVSELAGRAAAARTSSARSSSTSTPSGSLATCTGIAAATDRSAPVPALAAQHGIAGEFLAPWSRDFFTVVAR